MNGHPQFDEDFDLYVLGTLDLEERGAVELHLSQCRECEQKFARALARMAVLGLAAPSETPPAGVRERLMQRVRAEAPKRRPEAAPVQPFWRWPTLGLAAACAVLVIAAGWLTVENRRLDQEMAQLETTRQQLEAARAQEAADAKRALAVLDVLTAPDTLKVTLVAGTARPVPQGKAFYNQGKGLVFYAANLPAVPADRQTYQLWIVPAAGNPISAGIFNTDAQGNGEVVLPLLPGGVTAKAFAVTVEPAGGVPQPTGPKVLIGAVS